MTDTHRYRTGFRGPGKYDGSVVNWINGPLLAHVGAPRWASTSASSRSATGRARNIVTMTAQVRD